MAMFKGFKQMDLIATNPLFLIAILSEELVRTNTALEAVSEEVKQLKKTNEVKKERAKLN